ncbi:hypothetical protein H4S07_003006 [Coemansia furcata]|uniref:Uncharacterized protein n=1 Tax=Coemansia furcata TaxID=417177 RepID=A0ACC1LIW1_9FUNG|nr:hypothetical protein H4S07_003006 [Coemansia furcata]
MSALFSIFFALLCVLCTASAQLTSDSVSQEISSYIEKPILIDITPLESLSSEASSNRQANDIIGGVIACVLVIALFGGGIAYLVYKRIYKKRAALDAKAAMCDSISEAKTLV